MPSKSGSATDYRDLLDQLLNFIQAKATFAAPSYTGAGNGALIEFDSAPQAPSETWTLACANATKQGITNYGATVAADAPVLYWRLGEATVTVAEDETAGNRDGYFGVARYWRINVTAVVSATICEIGEVQFRWSVGGASLVGQGAAFASSGSGATGPNAAFDGNGDTYWAETGSTFPQWIAYDFGSPVQVGEYAITARGTGFFSSRNPKDFTLDYSHDATTWITVASVINQTGWSSGQTRVFAGGAASTGVTVNQTGLLSVDSNKAYSFPGAANGVVGSNPLQSPDLSGNLTLECVFKTNTLIGQQGFIALCGGINYLANVELDEGYLKISHGPMALATATRATGYRVQAGATYHIALARDVATKTYKLYANGLLVYEFVYIIDPPDQLGRQSVVIGSNAAGANFLGLIDEVAIYDDALDAATVLAHAIAAVGHEVFTVTGSASGAQANLTVGVGYRNAFLHALITEGTVNFTVGNQFQTIFTAGVLGAQGWDLLRRDKNAAFVLGSGLSGVDSIYAGFETYFDATLDYYNWRMRAMDGYDAAQELSGQPNASPETFLPLWNTTIAYKISATGRCFILVALITTTQQSMYCGLALPHATPSQVPYPMVIGGSSGSATNRYSNATDSSRAFFHPGPDCIHFRNLDGSWKQCHQSTLLSVALSNYLMHPYFTHDPNLGRNDWALTREDPSGVICAERITIVATGAVDDTIKGVLMSLDLCVAVTGFGNAADNIVTIDGLDYRVVQNVFRTGIGDYMAVRMD